MKDEKSSQLNLSLKSDKSWKKILQDLGSLKLGRELDFSK
jgi:hypothetical protein